MKVKTSGMLEMFGLIYFDIIRFAYDGKENRHNICEHDIQGAVNMRVLKVQSCL